VKAGLSQNLRLGQELKINPRLYQAMDMLYMPLLDLQQHLKQELEINPFLDLADDDDLDQEENEGEDGENGENESTDEASDDDATLDASGDDDSLEDGELPDAQAVAEGDATDTDFEPEPVNAQEDTDWEDILLNGFESEGGMAEQKDDAERFEPTAVSSAGLEEHLHDQIQMLDLDPRRQALADEFLGNISDDGYLGASLQEILDGINGEISKAAEAAGMDDGVLPFYTMSEAEAMLEIIQRLDPPGIAARDLRECLHLQLRETGRAGSIADRLVLEFFDELVAHRWGDVAKRIGVTPAAVQAAADEIARLSPKPGSALSSKVEHYVIPDMIVQKVDGVYLVFVNDGEMPRLKLSRVYQEIARDKKKFEGENKEFIVNKLNAAQWLVQAIEQRRQTMLKVMHFIVDRQRDFFEKGVKFLKPLTLREVADVIGMHESTVSRVTNEKYAQTPRGVLPLKFFFSSGLSTVDGEDVSARGIKATIETLVKGEDPKDPLTDQQIVEKLEAEGVQIARRTVAKYREQLGVLSARMRKRV
jgi:RNA polymerase sigma-54 factor